MKLDPLSLRLFLAVMEENAIARAAQREHIAPSAASRRLAELEQQLKVSLFTRSNRGMEPTAAAFALQNLARGVLDQMDGIAQQMRDYGSGMRGQVRIAANISAITQFLPAELQQFLQRYPQVDIRLQEQISTAVARQVADNAADIGILNAGHYGPGVQQFAYRRDELVLIMPADHALAQQPAPDGFALAEALEHDFIGLHPGSAMNHLLQQAANAVGQSVRMRMEVTSYDAQCLMVAAGMGIGVLPRGSAALYQGSLPVVVRPLREPWARRRLALCVRSVESLSSAGRLLFNHLRAADDAPAADD
ncbi:MAG: LysR family transcriptional regulator [Comamonas sp.]